MGASVDRGDIEEGEEVDAGEHSRGPGPVALRSATARRLTPPVSWP